MKNWNDNKNSIFKSIGASNHCHSEREENDFYATDPISVIKLLEVEKFNDNIIEPCVGQGHIAGVLKLNDYNVECFDIIDRGYENTNILNFLEYDKLNLNVDIITNPPYKYALDFLIKSLNIVNKDCKVAMFLKLSFLEGQKRYLFFKDNPPKILYVFSKRQSCAKNGVFIVDDKKISGAVAYGWFIWEKGFKGNTIIKWI